MSDINKDLIEIIQDNTRVQTKSASNQEAIVSLLKEVLAALKEASVERIGNKDVICESKRMIDALTIHHDQAATILGDLTKYIELAPGDSYQKAVSIIIKLSTLPEVLKDINEYKMIKKARNAIIVMKFSAGVVAFSSAFLAIMAAMIKVFGFKIGG